MPIQKYIDSRKARRLNEPSSAAEPSMNIGIAAPQNIPRGHTVYPTPQQVHQQVKQSHRWIDYTSEIHTVQQRSGTHKKPRDPRGHDNSTKQKKQKSMHRLCPRKYPCSNATPAFMYVSTFAVPQAIKCCAVISPPGASNHAALSVYPSPSSGLLAESRRVQRACRYMSLSMCMCMGMCTGAVHPPVPTREDDPGPSTDCMVCMRTSHHAWPEKALCILNLPQVLLKSTRQVQAPGFLHKRTPQSHKSMMHLLQLQQLQQLQQHLSDQSLMVKVPHEPFAILQDDTSYKPCSARKAVQQHCHMQRPAHLIVGGHMRIQCAGLPLFSSKSSGRLDKQLANALAAMLGNNRHVQQVCAAGVFLARRRLAELGQSSGRQSV